MSPEDNHQDLDDIIKQELIYYNLDDTGYEQNYSSEDSAYEDYDLRYVFLFKFSLYFIKNIFFLNKLKNIFFISSENVVNDVFLNAANKQANENKEDLGSARTSTSCRSSCSFCGELGILNTIPTPRIRCVIITN